MGYTAGQCTDFVSRFFPWAANTQWGDAYQWLAKAQRDGHAISPVPVPGSIAVWGQNMGGALADGHVAAVIGLDNAGRPVVQEMNWTNGPGRQDTRDVTASSAAGIIGYILPSNVAGGTVAPSTEAVKPSGNPPQSATLTSLNPLDWASGLGTLVGDILSGQFWWKVGFVALGVALVVGGIVFVVHRDMPNVPGLSTLAEVA